MNNFNFNLIDITFTGLKTYLEDWIKKLYKKADQVFSPASPYGHILQALEMIYQLQMVYLKNTVNQFDLSSPTNLNKRTIRTLSIIGGHNPVRGQCATGTLMLQVVQDIAISKEIPGQKVTFINKSKIRNKSNNLDYFLDLGANYMSFNVVPGTKIYLPVKQGVIYTQTFTGQGTENQSFAVIVSNNQEVAEDGIIVRVNGSIWTKRDHIYDMLPDEEAYVIRTGFERGIEIWFGNGNFGSIPEVGEEILVEYIVTAGSDGNILNNIANDWVFIDEVYDMYGGIIDIEKNFIITIDSEINFGSDGESVEFTKSIMPFISRNFVLSRPENFTFVLKRLNIFSQVFAYTTEKGSQYDNKNPLDDSIVYLFLVPNYTIYLKNNTTASYFNLNINAFYLDDAEQDKVLKYLYTQGTVGIGIGVKIIQPVISKYVLNISLYIYETADENNLRKNILTALSDYFMNLQRRDRIPKSDLIKVIENVNEVDSVSILILSEKNETYHKQYYDYVESIMKANPTVDPTKVKMEGYDPDLVSGLDPDLNDIVIDKNELPLIRGGWSDRFGNYYNDVPVENGLGSVNFIIKGYTPRIVQIQQQIQTQ